MRKIILLVFVCAILASPVACISRWFSASFQDLKFTLYRYGYCVNGLTPFTTGRLNETEFLVSQIKTFLDQGSYSNEQLANVSSLMDTICRTSTEPTYPISYNVNVTNFNSNTNPNAKSVRCHAIDDALDSMYHVFKRAAMNNSEPLDFSSIQFYGNETDKSSTYNLSDLINTSWITSEVVLEHVCSITNATKEYVVERSSKLASQKRLDSTLTSLRELIDLLLEPLFGLQKRLSWEASNRFEFIQNRVSYSLGSVRDGIGHGLSVTRDYLTWRPKNGTRVASSNATEVRLTNLTTTTSSPRFNSTGKSSTSFESVATSPTTTTTTTTTTPSPRIISSTATTTTTSTPMNTSRLPVFNRTTPIVVV